MDYIVKRRFDSLLATGAAATAICFVFALLYWPVWGSLTKAIVGALGAKGLAGADPKLASKYTVVFTEGTFFWCIINAWVWQTLIFGNYGKTRWTDLQPKAGLWYTFVSFVLGIGCFVAIIGFLGIWWKPFSFAILFQPQNAAELHLAIEGWEAANFYALGVIIAQIPFAALWHKWPFAGNIKPPWDGFGVMMTSTAVTLVVWMGIFIPSFMRLSLGGHEIVAQPFGSWPNVLAFCQAFVFWFLIPAEGGEHYPMKLFSKKQPYMGLVGFVIALAGGFATPPLLAALVGPLNLLPGAPIGVICASLELSVIVFMLTWHHLFDDWPTAAMVPSTAARVWTRIAIWVVGGSAFGVLWLKTFKYLPFAGNDLGMGYPVMGVLAGQFAFVMVVLYFNTFFDKWPLVYKEAAAPAKAGAEVAR